MENSYEKLKAIPTAGLLNGADAKLNLIIIGYPWCPYSKKAIDAANRTKRLSGSRMKFLKVVPSAMAENGYQKRPSPFDDPDKLRTSLEYKGRTFPIIFVRDGFKNEFRFLPGGSSGLDAYVGQSRKT